MRVRVTIVCLFIALMSWAQGQVYMCEIGLQGGCGYYVGDAAPHIFMNPREAYGIHFRYKFTKRWAIQAKVSGQRITGKQLNKKGDPIDEWWYNRLYNIDIVAEFNFLRFGPANKYDKRIKPYTPYIFLGLGGGIYGHDNNEVPQEPVYSGLPGIAGYIPLGIGFKWKFHERVGLNIAWQHNIYFADDLEAVTHSSNGHVTLNDKYHMNGMNVMNCDLTGMLTVGIVVEFARPPQDCRVCNTD